MPHGMSQWAYAVTGGFNRRPNTNHSLDLRRAARPAWGRAHVHFSRGDSSALRRACGMRKTRHIAHQEPSRRDVVENDVDLDRAARVDLHLAADETSGEARREHVDVVLPGRQRDLERTGLVRRAGGFDLTRIAEVDRRGHRRKPALVLDRPLHDHAAPEAEIDLDIAGAESDRVC